tara:strand:+ start:228 stop:1070 length:843 start_codon:yes stop_codon:yes gene_type:complete
MDSSKKQENDNVNPVEGFFLKNLEYYKKEKLARISDIVKETGLNHEYVESSINGGITLHYENRNQHVVFCGDGYCSLDTEETVRTCLNSYLRNNGFVVIGELGKELPFSKPELLRLAVNLCGRDRDTIVNQLTPYLKSNGIDVLAYSNSHVTVIELKGVTKEKSDFNETIIQMIKRYTVFKNTLSESEFGKVRFACGFPNFLPNISKEHYKKQFDILKCIIHDNNAELLYKFQSTPATRKDEGMKLLRPFVEGKPNIIDLVKSNKFLFYLVESPDAVLKL